MEASVLKLEEAAKLLRLSTATVRELVNQGQLEARRFRVGHKDTRAKAKRRYRLLFEREAIERFLQGDKGGAV